MNNSIILETENGEKVTFYVEEETRVNGTSYLLVSDSRDEDANAYIFKDVSDAGDEEAKYVPIDDDNEFEAVAELFSRMMDEADLIRE